MSMIPKPSQLPLWAVQDQIDPVSMQNNVLTPPPEMQQYGWTRQQFPPRNWFNWLGRYTYNWLNWLNQQESQSVVLNAVNATPTAPIFNIINANLFALFIVDTGNTANYLQTMGYVPAAPVSNPTFNTLATNGVITLASSTTGSITVAG